MKPKTKALLFILLAFILGTAAGVVVDRRGWFSMEHRMTPQEFRAEFHRRLALRDDQVAHVDSLIEAYRDRQFAHREVMARTRDTLRLEIRSLLTEEQRGRYEAFIREIDERSSRARPDTLHTNTH